MKKIMSAAVLLIIAATMYGQDFQKYKISFRVNPNVGWMVPQNNSMEATGASLRFGFGVATDILFTENYAVGTGINIDNMGGRLTYLAQRSETNDTETTNYIVEQERSYNLKYVEIPLTLKLRTNEIGYITYWGQFGFGLGVNWRANADETNDFLSYYNEDATAWQGTDKGQLELDNEDISDDINIMRASLIIAVGAEYNLSGSTSLVAGLTFNNGFTNIFSKSAEGVERQDGTGNAVITQNGPTTYKLKSNNNYIGLTIGVLF